jgi:hypothetical protein
VGFYWSAASRGGTNLVDFAAHGGNPGDGDGVMVLPDSEMCAWPGRSECSGAGTTGGAPSR